MSVKNEDDNTIASRLSHVARTSYTLRGYFYRRRFSKVKILITSLWETGDMSEMFDSIDFYHINHEIIMFVDVDRPG